MFVLLLYSVVYLRTLKIFIQEILDYLLDCLQKRKNVCCFIRCYCMVFAEVLEREPNTTGIVEGKGKGKMHKPFTGRDNYEKYNVLSKK